MTTKPNHWTAGTTTEDGWTVARVRPFFAVLKKQDEKDTTWAVELLDGKRLEADSSVDAGEKGRAYRDAQKAQGVTVERDRNPAKAKKNKATAKRA